METCLRKHPLDGSNLNKDGTELVETRSLFKIRILDTIASTKFVSRSEKLSMAAKERIKQSRRRRDGEKIMYEIKDAFVKSEAARFQADGGNIFTAAGAAASPIRGGSNFMEDIRMRSLAR